MTWQTVAPDTSLLGESPFWHPEENQLYWVDVDGRQVRRCNVFMGTVESWAMPSEPGCIAPARGGGLVIALRDGIYYGNWGDTPQLLGPAAHDSAKLRFNDGKADPFGRFWAATIFEPRSAPEAALYVLDPQLPEAMLQRKAGDATVGNGLAWSPDSKTLYWSDTTSHRIRAWDWDGAANVLSGERLFAQWPLKPAGWTSGMAGYGGRPDGAAVDVDGNYWVAMFEGARLLKLSPAGEQLAEFALPAQCPTMPCFGGDDLRTLYVTTARHNRPAAELERYPQSGCVFSMQVERPGLPVNFAEV